MSELDEDLPSDITALLREERARQEEAVRDFVPDAGMQARTWSRVEATVGGAAAGTGAAMTLAGKAGIAGIVVVGSLALLSNLSGQPPPEGAPPLASTPALAPPEPPAPPPAVAPGPLELPRPVARPPTRRHRTPSREAAPTTPPAEALPAAQRAPSVGEAIPATDTNRKDSPEERLLLEAARRKLADGSPQEALAMLKQHQQQFAKGRLGEERDAMRIVALVSLGKIDDAKQGLLFFKKEHPHSMLTHELEAALP
ncbi:MAG: hypothetical protein HY904_25955 [Deltaproteobacteria bacterium]|nr:hypothetical protein [Deltaproteobacteria bacterium]